MKELTKEDLVNDMDDPVCGPDVTLHHRRLHAAAVNKPEKYNSNSEGSGHDTRITHCTFKESLAGLDVVLM
jgi:hypothetical protein